MEDLIAYTVFIVLGFGLSAFYKWMTSKNNQFSYPAKLHRIVKKLPWIVVLFYPVIILDEVTGLVPSPVSLLFFLAGLAMVALILIAIVVALFHGQCRDRIAQPFDNPTTKKGWGYFMVVVTGLGTFFGIVIKALFELFLIALRSDVPTSSSTSNYSGESEQERDEREYGSGLVDDYGKYKD